MKTLRIFGIILMATVLMRSSCSTGNDDDCHHYISFSNNSDKTLLLSLYALEDTLNFVNLSPNPISQSHIYEVLPLEKNNTRALHTQRTRTCYEDYFNRSKNGVLSIAVFNKTDLAQIDWQDAPDYVLKRYDLTLDSLNKLNWTITY